MANINKRTVEHAAYRERIFNMIRRQTDPIRQVTLCQSTGITPTTVRVCLEELVASNMIEKIPVDSRVFSYKARK
jgi:DNA-binding GntR family transcriptional regulator